MDKEQQIQSALVLVSAYAYDVVHQEHILDKAKEELQKYLDGFKKFVPFKQGDILRFYGSKDLIYYVGCERIFWNKEIFDNEKSYRVEFQITYREYENRYKKGYDKHMSIGVKDLGLCAIFRDHKHIPIND